MQPLTLTDEEVMSLAEAILKRHGIDFTCYEPNSFKRRLVRAISVMNLSGLHELWLKILKEEGFMKLFMNEISVGLTSMFRDPVLWSTLRKALASSHRDPNEKISIWHAGCSTGEEVYTMGIVLREVRLEKNYQSFASDISHEALEKAKAGAFHKIKLIEFENNYRSYSAFGDFGQYYQRTGEYGHFDQSLTSGVQFGYHNLVSDSFTGKYDIIFCRNVMIYFDAATKVKLMEKFFKVLKPGGLLVVGFYDAINALINPSLFDLISEESKIYKATHRDLIPA